MTQRKCNRTIKLLLTVILIALTDGCMKVDEMPIEKHRYVIDISREDDSIGNAEAAGTLKVRRFKIASTFAGKGLVYRTGDVNYESDFYNQFLVSPDSMITDEVTQWLGESGVFSSVLDEGTYAKTEWVLEGKIFSLYGDYSMQGTGKAVMEIQFSLITDLDGIRSAAFENVYKTEVDILPGGGANLVKGFNNCLNEILLQYEQTLREVVTSKK